MADLEDYVSAVEANIVKILGVAPQLDDTDKLAVSLYGQGTNPGDTPLKVAAAGHPNLRISLYDPFSNTLFFTSIDADAQAQRTPIPAYAQNILFNGSTWDRQRANTLHTLLASAVRAATVNSSDQVNYNARGLFIFFSVTVVPGVQTVTLTVTSKDSIAGTYEVLLTGGAEVGVCTRCYLLYPGAGAAANGIDVANAFPVPRTWRVTVTHSGAGNFTYSVGAALIL